MGTWVDHDPMKTNFAQIPSGSELPQQLAKWPLRSRSGPAGKSKIRRQPQVRFWGSNGDLGGPRPYDNQFRSNSLRNGISTAACKKTSSSQVWICRKRDGNCICVLYPIRYCDRSRSRLILDRSRSRLLEFNLFNNHFALVRGTRTRRLRLSP